MNSPSEEVKNRLDIAEVIGGYMRLNPSGANLKALCPFHHEKTPSFYVSKDKQVWHCFGCGLGGDLFSFVMKIEGLEFPEALRMLADRAGVELRQEDPRVRSERARILEVLKAATSFYQEMLLNGEQKDVRTYLERRKLADETRDAFRLGYAPSASWDALVHHLKFKGFRPEEGERAGVMVKSERGEYRDRFHNRVMFPLCDAQGIIVGFTGRIFEPRHAASSTVVPAKYVNTPETPVYNKGRILYGLHAAKDAIRERQHAVLLEGQFDLLLSHQSGVRNAVATSGTALTTDHARLLKRYTSSVSTAFDNDTAGEAATKRSIMLLLAHDMTVHFIHIEKGKDPADLAAEMPDAWVQAVASARPVLDHYMERAAGTGVAQTADEKRRICSDLLPLVGALANPVLKGHYLAKLAEALRIEERYLREALEKTTVNTPMSKGITENTRALESPLLPRNRWTDIEEFLLAFLVKHPDVGRGFLPGLSQELFSSPVTRTLYPFVSQWVTISDASRAPMQLTSDLDVHLRELVLKADRYVENLPGVDPEREIANFVRELSARQLRERLRTLGAELKHANVSVRTTILGEFTRLSSELQRHERVEVATATPHNVIS